MNFTKHRRDVVELFRSCHDPSSCILNVQFLQRTVADTVQQAVTVVKTAAEESVYKCLCGVRRSVIGFHLEPVTAHPRINDLHARHELSHGCRH